MTRQTTLALAAALAATLSLAACKKEQPAPVAPATAPAAMPAPMAPAPAPVTPDATGVTVVTVDLGNAVGADNKIATPKTAFAGKDTITASVATDGAGGNVSGKWTYQDGQVINEESKLVAAGPQVTAFSISKPDGFPAGNYKLEVSVNGVVVQTRDFTVQ